MDNKGNKSIILADKLNEKQFVADIRQIVTNGRQMAYNAVNTAMVKTYWAIGRRIVEQEQLGNSRAEYGKHLLQVLSGELTKEFGKAYSTKSLYYYRQFYLTFGEIFPTLRGVLTWSHYKRLLSVADEKARLWYLKEATEQMWSARTLDRNISTQYYYRLLQSQHKEPVVEEILQKTSDYQHDKLEFIKNPIVAEFLALSSNIDFTETELESCILTHLQKFLMKMEKDLLSLRDSNTLQDILSYTTARNYLPQNILHVSRARKSFVEKLSNKKTSSKNNLTTKENK